MEGTPPITVDGIHPENAVQPCPGVPIRDLQSISEQGDGGSARLIDELLGKHLLALRERPDCLSAPKFKAFHVVAWFNDANNFGGLAIPNHLGPSVLKLDPNNLSN